MYLPINIQEKLIKMASLDKFIQTSSDLKAKEQAFKQLKELYPQISWCLLAYYESEMEVPNE